MLILRALAPLLILFTGFFASFADATALPPPPQVRVDAGDSTATLMAPPDALAQGAPVPLLLTLAPQPGWHTYWQNPGDAGAALTLDWELPAGFAADPVRWPVPERIITPPLVSFGYTGPVTFPLTIQGPVGDAPLPITVTVRYLVCADTCIPQSARLSLLLPSPQHRTKDARDRALQDWATAWAHATSTLPQDLPQLTATAQRNPDATVTVAFPRAHLPTGDWQDAFFFPLPPGALVHSAAQHPQSAPETLTLTLTPQARIAGKVPGLLRLETAAGQVTAHPVTLTLPPLLAPADTASLASSRPGQLVPLAAVALAFVGGLILNLMPCVFPVLSLKILALSRHSHHTRRQVLHESLAYTAGVVGSFVALAAGILVLRGAAGELGWGFQLQEPWFVGALALLLFAVGLNLSGVYEIPQVWHGTQPHREGWLQSALTGVLAVLLATPCTAPFMAPAIGFGLAQPPLVTLMIFVALGTGFALPFVIAGVYPGLLRLLPRPGRWMLTFRRILAIPLYASAIWLVWVLAQQTTPNGVGLILAAGLVLATALTWLPHWGTTGRMILVILTTVCLVTALRALPIAPKTTPQVTEADFSITRLEELRAAGRPVLVNVTAAWCITCKLNERLVLQHPDIRALLQARGITVLTADWTRGDPVITNYLQLFNRAGVPLYVYYATRDEPVVFPQILAVTTVTELLNKD